LYLWKEWIILQNINLSMPDDILFEVKSLPMQEKNINDKLQVALAVGMFVSKEISLAKAAQLARKDIEEFIYFLAKLDIPSIVYTEDMLEDDLQFAKVTEEA
jgi:predicted HTH domain antitoxin